MTDLTVDASCRRHLGIPAVGTCRRCDKAFCAACRVESIATESSYCSAECLDAVLRADHGQSITDEALLAGYRAPFRSGSITWLRAFADLNSGVAPLSILAVSLPLLLGGFQSGGPGLNGRLTVALIAVAVFGAAAVSIVISRSHTGHAGGPALLHALQRFVPWVLTWLLMLGVTIVGYLLLVVPGIYWSMRVFWADEFALVHRVSPFRALDESWQISRTQAGKTFALEFVLGFVLFGLVFAFGFTLAMLYVSVAPLLPEVRLRDAVFAGLGMHLLLLIYAFAHSIQVAMFYALRRMASTGATEGSGKRMPRLLQWSSVPAALVVAALIGMGALMETGNVPSDRVIAGADLPGRQYEALLREGIVGEGEKVEYFYSEGLWSVLEGGSILTDHRVIAYETGEDRQLHVYEVYLEDIGSVELVQQGDALSFSVYQVSTENEEYWLHLWLPHEYDDDKTFIRAVQERIN